MNLIWIDLERQEKSLNPACAMGLPVRRLAANTYMFCMLNKLKNLQ